MAIFCVVIVVSFRQPVAVAVAVAVAVSEAAQIRDSGERDFDQNICAQRRVSM